MNKLMTLRECLVTRIALIFLVDSSLLLFSILSFFHHHPIMRVILELARLRSYGHYPVAVSVLVNACQVAVDGLAGHWVKR